MLPHPIHLHKSLIAGIHNTGQAAKGVQQPVGNGIGIPLGDRIEEGQFQEIDRVKVVQPLGQKAFFEPLTMLAMDGGLRTGHRDLSFFCYSSSL